MSFEETRDMLADIMGPYAYSLEAEPLIREMLIERQNRSYDDWLSLRWQGIQDGSIPCP
ncbi:MAG: hypothetical protein OXL97_00665 [Chloroflexota bacterium]|nr:hypothetical protein [Chloroflexota bacterium]MDE2883655.1 hypothetical protein [Chloroflexota bacterium]